MVDVTESEEIIPIGENHFNAKFTNTGYKTDFARVGPFITAYARARLLGYCTKYSDRVVAWHTDGFTIIGEDPEIKLGKGIGELKMTNQGECTVHNANDVKFVKNEAEE